MKASPLGVVQGRLTRSPPGQLQWFPQESWEDEFRLAKENGLDYIELIAERNHNPRNPLWSDDGVKRIQELCLKYGLKIFTFCNDYIIDHSFTADPEVLEQNLRLIDQGKKIGVKKYILPFFEKSEITADNFRDFIPGFRKLASYAEERGIHIDIETVLNADELKLFLKELNHPNVACVFDTGNRIAFGHDIYAEIKALGSSIRHVHIKDKDSTGANVLLGTGNVNFKKVFDSLRDIGYAGAYTFETNRGNDPIATIRFHKQLVDFFANEAGIATS